MVKNKVVDNKVVFLFKRETTLVADDKHEIFFIAPHFLPSVSKLSIAKVYLAISCTLYTCPLQAGFQAPSKHTCYRWLNFLCVEMHFQTLTVVDSIKPLIENSCR